MNLFTKLFISVGYILLFIFESTAKDTNERIIGGSNATIGKFNFAAAINVTTTNTNYFCMGSLIDLQFVVTSASCINNGVLFVVQFGSLNLKGEDENRLIAVTSEYYTHPNYNPNSLENDIGLLKMQENIWFNDYIGPVYLPLFNLTDSEPITLIGWGQTSESNSTLSETLQTVDGNMISNLECQTTYGSQIKTNMACVVGTTNQGTCIGDMGGPLLNTWSGYYWLSGVASFVSGNGCESNNPSGFTRVLPYVEWIRAVNG